MTGAVVVDSYAFLGMHSADEYIQNSCKTFFAQRVQEEVWMSLEHVGWCDDVIWQYSRAMQDAYYPFMDTLHSEMPIRRVGYEKGDVMIALTAPELINVPMRERLLLGMVLHRSAVLYTASPWLRHRQDLPVLAMPTGQETSFPSHLEQLYQNSLALRLPVEAG